MSDSLLSRDVPRWTLLHRDTGCVAVGDLQIADGYWSKLAGLQFRARLPIGQGLLLVKSASIHTFWMRFAIDVAFIDSAGCVVGVRRGVKPWRVVMGAPRTHAILETTAGWLQLEMGDRLNVAEAGEGKSPRHQNLRVFHEQPGADSPDTRHGILPDWDRVELKRSTGDGPCPPRDVCRKPPPVQHPRPTSIPVYLRKRDA